MQVKGKKASWSTGSSFPLKKTVKVLPKIQLNDESDLIDEDSLLTEEDLKKPELPAGRISFFLSFISLFYFLPICTIQGVTCHKL
jgi:hypothetical protein